MVEKGRVDKAIICFQEALRIKPDYRNAHNNLNKTLKLVDSKLEN
jgi:tetratricopeptide (TPR) repeat protein